MRKGQMMGPGRRHSSVKSSRAVDGSRVDGRASAARQRLLHQRLSDLQQDFVVVSSRLHVGSILFACLVVNHIRLLDMAYTAVSEYFCFH
jgi:exopolysaccharide biosynthesis predicted pyruvyltransferase EpsI